MVIEDCGNGGSEKVIDCGITVDGLYNLPPKGNKRKGFTAVTRDGFNYHKQGRIKAKRSLYCTTNLVPVTYRIRNVVGEMMERKIVEVQL